ncbi:MULTISPECIES: transcriptional regulator [Bacillus]|nr:transcriptional regulator [Bacillus cereus]
MEKLYIIKYTHIMTGTGKDETRTHYFEESQKAQFLAKYVALKEAWYCYNLEAYRADKVTKLDVDSLLDF